MNAEPTFQSDSGLRPKKYRRLSSGLVIASHNFSGVVTMAVANL
jgi:hypothetical protein